ncbi:MAG: DegT/DnrJ/EryC1/StrS family aminotransferase [Terriglobia bacterium]
MKPGTRMQVPQIDLKAQYAGLKEEMQAALGRVCESQRFILGPEGLALERELAAYCGVTHALGCASGSDALLLSLVTMGVGPGDEVVTVPFTFFSTAGSVARLGARVSFVDIDPGTLTLDPQRLESHLENLSSEQRRRTRAIIPVHLYGQTADMAAIGEVAGRFDLPLIEDAAQALGAEFRGQRAGSLGRTACFSFYPSKNLGAYGDAGLVATNDSEVADRLRALRQHGCTHERYKHDMVGWNSRLDEMQAAVLRVKFRHLEEWTAARQQCADRYDQLLRTAGLADDRKFYPDRTHPVTLPRRAPGRRHVFHQYVIRCERRDVLRRFLAEEGVGTAVYYPVPLHLQECFAPWGGRAGDCPEAERAAAEVLALPLYPELTAEMQEYVVNRVGEFYQRGGTL